jgi:hypothetical protein
LTIKFSQDKKNAAKFDCQRSEKTVYRITPNLGGNLVDISDVRRAEDMVELAGIEPATSGLQNRRSPN